MAKHSARLAALERATRDAGRTCFVICGPEDVAEAEAAREQGRRIYILCNPQYAHLIGGSVSGVVIGGLDLAKDI